MIGAVVIGRNEGARLEACLASLKGMVDTVIYVDSGSTDRSVATAKAAGAIVLDLDLSRPFTAARARNAGLDRLRDAAPDTRYVQFVDGDCQLRDGWIATASAFLDAHPRHAVACGRRRERHPDATLWNRLIDIEWAAPVGPTKACGGDALMRIAALSEVGGFDPTLIAGEEPELCVRLRAAGWRIERLDAEMTWHDAEMTRLSQWWQRARRAGHASAEGAALHGKGPERHGVARTQRALLWGIGLPVATLLGLVVTPWALALLLAYPAQIMRLAVRSGDVLHATFTVLAKFPEAQGVVDFLWARLIGQRRKLIEYK
ncbi:MAG: glycosyltransferase [Pseudomonadota bacterium]